MTPKSKTPVPKVQAAGGGGILALVVIAILEALGVGVSAELGSAITALAAFAAGYVFPQQDAAVEAEEYYGEEPTEPPDDTFQPEEPEPEAKKKKPPAS